MARLFKTPEQILEEQKDLLTLISQGSDPIAQAGAAGQIKSYGTGILSEGLAGNARITFSNPTGSAHMLTLIGLSTVATVAGRGLLRRAPTSGLPSGSNRPAFNALQSQSALPAGVAVVRADTNTTIPLGGGTDTGIVLGTTIGADEQLLAAPLWLLPGETLGWGASFTAAFELSANLTFIESPL